MQMKNSYANGKKMQKKNDFFKKASRKIPQRSRRFCFWNRTVKMSKNSMQKERNDKNAFSEIIKYLRLNKC
jgi:hypothetical protein